MEADWSVELAADDPVLEMPWASPDGSPRWQDLRRHPELIPQLAECQAYPEFIEPLRTLNASGSRVLSAKCDAFTPEATEPAEELYGTWRIVSYIDVLFAEPLSPNSTGEQEFALVDPKDDFALHEQFARDLSARLDEQPESELVNATCEAVIRRCVYKGAAASGASRDGFYFTLYVIGYGESPADARQHWSRALAICADEVLRVSRSA